MGINEISGYDHGSDYFAYEATIGDSKPTERVGMGLVLVEELSREEPKSIATRATVYANAAEPAAEPAQETAARTNSVVRSFFTGMFAFARRVGASLSGRVKALSARVSSAFTTAARRISQAVKASYEYIRHFSWSRGQRA